MHIEIGVPASLPLGLVKFDDKGDFKTCLLGLTVQHPPVNLFARANTKLQVTGARANKSHEQAVQFLEYHHLKYQAEVEIEYAIPMFVGLGSDALLGLGTAKALSALYKLPPEQRDTFSLAQSVGIGPYQALEYWGFDGGGLLLVGTEVEEENQMPALHRRLQIEHTEKEAWAMVFYFPDIPYETPENLEADRMTDLLQSAEHLSTDTGRLVNEELWPAAENDDIKAFGKSLLTLHQMNEEALAKAGSSLSLSADDQAILDVMCDGGAVAWGKNLTGLSFYGLVKGGQASRELRKKLRNQVGYTGGTILATITDNRGGVENVKDWR